METETNVKNFSSIVGLEDVKDHLQNAISMNKISHAYIISGEKDAGKMMLAEAFAATLLCQEGGRDACGKCHSCHQAAGRNHPDIIFVSHEKPNVISVDDVRHQINDSVMIKPYASEKKIYIVDEAEKMNLQAQNALLKTIEEPPAYVVILLLTTNAEGFLPTILSRCITLHLKPASEDQIEKLLMRDYHVVDYQARMCSAFAQGNVGKAIRLASSEEFREMKSSVLHMVKDVPGMNIADLQDAVKELEGYKAQIEEYLDLLTLWYRDVLLYKATDDFSQLIFRDENSGIRDQAQKLSYHRIDEILKEISAVRNRLHANVNYELTMELLLMKIKGE